MDLYARLRSHWSNSGGSFQPCGAGDAAGISPGVGLHLQNNKPYWPSFFASFAPVGTGTGPPIADRGSFIPDGQRADIDWANRSKHRSLANCLHSDQTQPAPSQALSQLSPDMARRLLHQLQLRRAECIGYNRQAPTPAFPAFAPAAQAQALMLHAQRVRQEANSAAAFAARGSTSNLMPVAQPLGDSRLPAFGELTKILGRSASGGNTNTSDTKPSPMSRVAPILWATKDGPAATPTPVAEALRRMKHQQVAGSTHAGSSDSNAQWGLNCSLAGVMQQLITSVGDKITPPATTKRKRRDANTVTASPNKRLALNTPPLRPTTQAMTSGRYGSIEVLSGQSTEGVAGGRGHAMPLPVQHTSSTSPPRYASDGKSAGLPALQEAGPDATPCLRLSKRMLQILNHDRQALMHKLSIPRTRNPIPRDARTAAEGSGPFKGVTRTRAITTVRWQAVVHHAGRGIYLGTFEDDEVAAVVYDIAVAALKGDRAPMNFTYKP